MGEYVNNRPLLYTMSGVNMVDECDWLDDFLKDTDGAIDMSTDEDREVSIFHWLFCCYWGWGV